MNTSRLSILQGMFLDYYRDCFNEVCVPSSLDRREFGGLLFKERIMVRHRQFRTADDLKDFLCSVIPSDVYYSSAYYEQPDAQEMGMKGWVGADLVFDIDADHLNTPCQKTHDEWTCTRCGFVGRGVRQKNVLFATAKSLARIHGSVKSV